MQLGRALELNSHLDEAINNQDFASALVACITASVIKIEQTLAAEGLAA